MEAGLHTKMASAPKDAPQAVHFRPYRGGDEKALVALWNRCLPADPISDRVFLEKVLCDANFDPEGLIVAEDPAHPSELTGFVLTLVRRLPLWGDDLEPENAWVTAFGVDPQWRRQGIGRRLLRLAEDFARARGRKTLYFASYAPNYFVPGLDAALYPEGAAFLQSLGFSTVYPCAAMDRSLVGYALPPEVASLRAQREKEGYRFGPLTVDRVAETIRFANEAFNPDWGRAIREAILRGVPLHQILIATDCRPNAVADQERNAAGQPQHGRVVGFAMYGAYDGVGERFGPFGVAETQRGLGLGKILLHLTMHEMRARGLHSSWFLWTGEDSPAGHLYLSAGYHITRRFNVLKKSLAESR